jgi:excisionase family DNA binding protein
MTKHPTPDAAGDQHKAADALLPVGASVKRACELLGITRTRLYVELATGRIRAWKAGRATVIDMASARAFLASLPQATFRPPSPRVRGRAVAQQASAEARPQGRRVL